MAGLSMSSMQTFQITMDHLDMFSYICGFSGTGGGLSGAPFDTRAAYHGVLSDSAFNKKVKLVWLGVGTAEPVRMYESIHGFHEALHQAGIDTVYFESSGTAHEWQSWRRRSE